MAVSAGGGLFREFYAEPCMHLVWGLVQNKLADGPPFGPALTERWAGLRGRGHQLLRLTGKSV